MFVLSIRFFLKESLKSFEHPIYVRVTYERSKFEMSIGMKSSQKDWNKAKEEHHSNYFINKKISSIRLKIYRIVSELEDAEISFDVKDIKRKLIGKKEKPMNMEDFFNNYIKKLQAEKRVKESTIEKYIQTLKHLQQFETLNDKPTALGTIRKRDLVKFDEYLKMIKSTQHKSLSISTISKHHCRLKTVLNSALEKGVIDKNPYQDFKLKYPKSQITYLSWGELNRIKKLPLNNNITLNKIRDVFLFSCYTGLRFCDAMSLKTENIIVESKSKYLKVNQLKTDYSIEIPLLKKAEEIIKKYDGWPFRTKGSYLLPRFSNQKINYYLKYIAEIAGIEKKLSHHVARHTCATTILLDNGVSLEDVSYWLGHQSIKTTQIYAKVTKTRLSRVSSHLENKLKHGI